MKEIKLKKIKNMDNYIAYSDIMVRKFLTIEEISDIANACLEEKDQLVRMVIRYTKLAEHATDIDMSQFLNDEEKIDIGELYNTLAENNLLGFEINIKNVRDLDNVIKNTESLYNALRDGVGEMNENLDTNELMESLTKVTQDLKGQQLAHEKVMS